MGGGRGGVEETAIPFKPRPLSPMSHAGFIPAVLDLSVDDGRKTGGEPRRFVDAEGFARALPILARRGIRYLNFQGGEPLRHPRIVEMLAAARGAGMKPSLVTDGWELPERADALADAGVQNLLVAIDSADMTVHEKTRGLPGLAGRIARGVARMRDRGVPVIASVAVSRLVDFAALPRTLERLGFDAATFSYPRKAPVGSAQAPADLSDEELLAALDAVLRMRDRFPVLNPAAAIRDMQRHVRGEPERFACVGGFKYFHMDWRLDVWRCEAWREPMGSVFDLDRLGDDRSRCTACMMSCYRDASTLMHAGVAAADAAAALAKARPLEAARAVFNGAVAQSVGATVAEAGLLTTLGRRETVRPDVGAARSAGW
jgi:MoaA/NifB/PqqE/SkfB family radical SAM enzyme